MRKISVLFVAVLAIVFCYGTAFGQMSSAKTAFAMGNHVNITTAKAGTAEDWDTIISTKVKMPEQKDLAFDVSLQCGLMTNTLVRSKGGDKNTATASASIKVRVEVKDFYGNPFNPPRYAMPSADLGTEDNSGVTFAARTQELTATFQGMIEGCITDGVINLTDSCLTPEEVGLMLDTMNANAFNFLYPNLRSGEYTIEVQAKIDDNESGTITEDPDYDYTVAEAKSVATIGLGSMIVEDVRMDNNKE